VKSVVCIVRSGNGIEIGMWEWVSVEHGIFTTLMVTEVFLFSLSRYGTLLFEKEAIAYIVQQNW
jgi:hypothetical protein